MRRVWAALVLAAGCGMGQASSSAVVAAPQPDAGAAPDAGGSPAPDAGVPDAGGPPDAGGAKTECDGLVPADAGEGFILDLDHGSASQLCLAAGPDEGSGTLPLRVSTYDNAGLQTTTWFFYRALDSALLTFVSWPYGHGYGPSVLLPQPQGFTGLSLAGDGVQFELRTFDHGGRQISSTLTTANASEGTSTPVPSGGMVVFSVDHGGAGYTLRFERYDATGSLVANSVAASGDTVSATQMVATSAGVTMSRDTLVVFGPSDRPCRAVWLDADGQRVSPYFAPATCRVGQIAALLDGRLAIESLDPDGNAHVESVIADRQTSITDAPRWLQRIALREFFLLPGGRGYALRRYGIGSPLEVFSPAGLKCGDLTTPELDKGPVLIGRDGTLVEQDRTTATGCTFRWYPQLFR